MSPLFAKTTEEIIMRTTATTRCMLGQLAAHDLLCHPINRVIMLRKRDLPIYFGHFNPKFQILFMFTRIIVTESRMVR